MIEVDKILNRCERILGLHKRKDYDDLDGYFAFAEAVLKIQQDANQVDSIAVTTVALQSDYKLPEEVNRIERIEWPTTWYQSLSPKTIQYLAAMRTTAIAATTVKPTIYSTDRGIDGQIVFSLEPHGGIIDDETITVYFIPASAPMMMDDKGNVTVTLAAGSQVALPTMAELMLKACVLWKLCEQYEDFLKKAPYWQNQYEAERLLYKSTQHLITNETYQAQNLEAY